MTEKVSIKMSNKPAKIAAGASRIPTSGRDSGTHSRSSSVSNLTTASDARSEVGDTVSENPADYTIGERVWVNGTKPGFIRFLGKTQFSPGIWAGVTLDEAVGKNDGSVEGIKYFECEPKKGIFARTHRLTREAGSPPGIGDSTLVESCSPKIAGNIVAGVSRGSLIGNISPIGSKVCSRLRLGEQVVVNSTAGIKTGILRYLGETDFAKGDWVGVELDQPVGKNDGTVAGKRYFNCKMKHGLFAPLHKVSHAGGTTTPRSGSVHGSSLCSRNRSGSRDSLNSSISSCSTSRAASRVKLGITSLTNAQEAIKEKEQHIEQLLKERDLERAEVARAASQYEEAQKKLTELRESEARASQLLKLYEAAEAERKCLEGKVCKDQRKLEDLQFQMEEELIAKGDLEIQLQKKKAIFKELEDFASTQLGEQFHCVKQILQGQEYSREPILEQQKSFEKESTEDKISKLEFALQNALKEKDTLSNEIMRIKEQSAESEAAEREKEILLSSSKITIQEKDDFIVKISAELNSATEKIAQLSKDNDNLNVQVQQQTAEVQTQGKAVAEIEEFRQKTLCLTGEVEKLSAILQEKIKLIEEKDEEISKFRTSLDTTGSQLLQLQSDVKALELKLNQSEIEKTNVQKAFEEKTIDQKNESESTFSRLQKENYSLSEEIKKVSEILKEKAEQFLQKENEVNSWMKAVKDKEENISELNIKVKKAEECFSVASKESSEKVDMLQSELVKLKEEYEKLKCESDQEANRISVELKSTSEELKIKSDTVADFETQISSIKHSLIEKDSALMKSEAQVNELKEKYQLLIQEKNTGCSLQEQLENETKKLQQEIERLSSERNSQLLEKDNERETLLKTLENKDKEMMQLNLKLEEAEKEVLLIKNNFSAQISTLESSLTKLNCEADEMKLKSQQDMIEACEKNEKLSSVLDEKELELKQVKESLSSLQKSAAEKDMEISEAQSRFHNLQQEVEILSKDKTEGQTLLQKQLTDIRNMTDLELKKRESVVEQLKNEIEKYSQISETKDTEVNKKDNEIKSLRTIVKEKEMQFDQLSEMIESSRVQLVQLEQQNINNLALLQSKESYINEFKADQEKKLLQKEQLLKEEAARFQINLKEKDEEAIKNKANILDLTACVEDYEKKIKVLQTEIEKNNVESSKMLNDSSHLHEEFSSKIADLELKCSNLLQEKEKLAQKELATSETKKNLESMRDSLLEEKVEQQAIVKDREAKLEALQIEVTRMQAQFSQHKQELQQKLDVSKMELQAALELKNQLEVQHCVLEELQQELQESEDKCKKLEATVKNLSAESAGKSELENTLADFKILNEETLERIGEVEKQNSMLEKMLEDSKSILQQKEIELQNLNKQLEPLQKDTILYEKLKISLKKLEDENLSLKNKVVKLETSAINPNINAAAPENTEDQEKESLLSQIDFLNSIIVDMKQKNEELAKNLEEQSTCWVESDVNLNNTKKQLAPRLFCDICDMFDLHDTEDCPKQTSFEEEEVPHLKVQGSRLLDDRPYCNTCEVFGHWTLDCDEPDTF